MLHTPLNRFTSGSRTHALPVTRYTKPLLMYPRSRTSFNVCSGTRRHLCIVKYGTPGMNRTFASRGRNPTTRSTGRSKTNLS